MSNLRVVVGEGERRARARAAAVVRVVALGRDDPVVPAEVAEAHVVGLPAAVAAGGGGAVERASLPTAGRLHAQAQQRPRRLPPAQPQPHAPRAPRAVQQQPQRLLCNHISDELVP